jgi:hypothetical protein
VGTAFVLCCSKLGGEGSDCQMIGRFGVAANEHGHFSADDDHDARGRALVDLRQSEREVDEEFLLGLQL